MKIIHISTYDSGGGAGRAAFRLHCALRRVGINSLMWVSKRNTDDHYVIGPDGDYKKFINLIKPHILKPLKMLLKTKNSIIHSPGLLNSSLVKKINNSDADIINLHWFQDEMLSISDISKIKKPILWTLHDMWAFCGAEHIAWDERWRFGYAENNRPAHESGFDLNRWVWNKKLKYWKHPIEVVTPSKWLSGCVRSSLIMKGWPCKVIPNPIDTDFWSPLDAETCRQLMKLPLDKKLIGFGALGGSHAHHKGFDLLKEAILKIRNLKSPNELGLVVLGQSKPLVPPELGFPIYYVGHLHDELSIKILYNCLDVFVIPSRNDNLPNMAVEAQACGVPVVGFDIGGVSDIVDNNVTGYLAKPFDIEDLSTGIIGVLDAGRTSKKIKEIHEITKQKFSYSSISMKYIAKYKEIISSCNVA